MVGRASSGARIQMDINHAPARARTVMAEMTPEEVRAFTIKVFAAQGMPMATLAKAFGRSRRQVFRDIKIQIPDFAKILASG